MKKQKVWFITGASRGFGLDIAKAALATGDKVVATVRRKADQLTATLKHHENLLVVVLDVTDEIQVKEGVGKAIARFGQIDVLVNNAGYGLLGATEEVTDAEIRKQYDTNVFGLLNVTRAALPFMRAKKAGHVINISSLLAYSAAVPGLGLYGSSKAAIEGISEGLALEVKPLGIKVTAVAPGQFSTDFLAADSFVLSENALGDYSATVGQLRGAAAMLHGNQPGDPARLADVIIDLANAENPPLHLPIGNDAVNLVRASAAKIEKDVATWEVLSRSTDRVQATATA